jgi:hypothetical protein
MMEYGSIEVWRELLFEACGLSTLELERFEILGVHLTPTKPSTHFLATKT